LKQATTRRTTENQEGKTSGKIEGCHAGLVMDAQVCMYNHTSGRSPCQLYRNCWD